MTRETKIGLLVGLAFIIVIGILLEDHFSSINDPKPAQLTGVGNDVRRGYGQVAGGTNTQAPVITQVGEPQRPVPMPQDLTNRDRVREIIQVNDGSQQPGGDARVSVGPGGDPIPLRGRGRPDVVDNHQPNNVVVNNGNNNVGPMANGNNVPPDNNVNRGLNDLANRYGEQVVPITGNRGDNTGVRGGGDPRQYVAQPGDSLSRMAGRFLGANTKANRDAIIRLNPSLQQNPDRIIVGESYLLPAALSAPVGGSTATPRTGDIAPDPQPIRSPREIAAGSPPTGGSSSGSPAETFYTVKRGDTLWSIAVQQCGTSAAQAAIKELNRERFTDGNTGVVIGWKLRLPSRVATAN